MKIAILGAMEAEITPILTAVDKYEVTEYANNKYYFSQYAGHELILAYSKIGKVFSALSATIMIERFGAQMLLFSGVAGGAATDIQVGDLVVATQTAQHDIDISAFGRKRGEIPGNEVFISTCDNLKTKLEQVAQMLSIELKQGIIVTGDQFIHNAQHKIDIAKHFGAHAIEMEGASVNLVCRELSTPCLILRAISDTADGQAVDDFPKFVAMAAERSAKLILSLVESI
ncbi:5'-methylthioadenosine/adenosylhomocysteine nucleosidase [Fastidiosibacter lacustris]|uniref:5'-methylthioadenosine/adenosylhomocysteine nucleosidase n=1 Tax=Fastidiosibacter lacustris TaxID=2056695 RepID=UPI000E352911|nr:5'-methylthioadenosine/adenosylhomocysteine nucleosidase [Fastidiosibacter lacustris]